MTDFTLGPGPLMPEFEQIKSDIGIVENGNTATHAIPSGSYVIWKGDLYIAKTDISSGTALGSSNLTAKTNGIGGEVKGLSDKIKAKDLGTLTSLSALQTAIDSQVALMSQNDVQAVEFYVGPTAFETFNAYERYIGHLKCTYVATNRRDFIVTFESGSGDTISVGRFNNVWSYNDLSDQIRDLKFHGSLDDGTDLNTVRSYGAWWVAGNRTYTNSPATYGIIFVFGTGLPQVQQTFYGGHRMWTRTNYDGGTDVWSPWMLYDTASASGSIASSSSATFTLETYAKAIVTIIGYRTASIGEALVCRVSSTGFVIKWIGEAPSNITITMNSSGVVTIQNDDTVSPVNYRVQRPFS